MRSFFKQLKNTNSLMILLTESVLSIAILFLSRIGMTEYNLSLYLTFMTILLLISNSTLLLGNMLIFCILKRIFLYEKHAPLSTCLVYFTVSKVSRLIDLIRGTKEFLSLFAFTPNLLLYFFT